MIRRGSKLGMGLLMWLLVSTVMAGPLRVDTPVRAGGLWCLQDSANPLQYRYLPSEARLSRRDDGSPLFSLLYYSQPSADASASSSVGKAEGGALLNFMVEYYTPKGRIKRAAHALTKLVHAEAELIGPVVFDDGTYSLISSTTSDAGVRFADGNAPVLAGSKVAVSIRLDSQAAKLLDVALQSSTPDLSLVFDMLYSGVRSSFDADITIDWEKVSKSLDRGLKAGISVYGIGVGGEIEHAVSNMMSNGAISIEVRGEDENMEGIVADIQQTATKLFFTPLEEVEADDNFGQIGMPEIPTGGGANRYFSVNAQIKYKVKDIATSGSSTISLSKASAASRRWSIVFDAGEIAADLVGNPEFVRTEDISTRSMSVRQIVIKPDLELVKTFSALARSVDIEIIKTHSDGRETFRQTHLSAADIEQGKEVVLTYPRFDNEAWDDWLEYRYRVIWAMRDQQTSSSVWQTIRGQEINLSSPLRTATIYPIGQMEALKSRGVRAVVIEVRYPFLDQTKTVTRSSMIGNQPFAEFTVWVPHEHSRFDYTVTHIYELGRRVTFNFSDRAGFVPFDQITSREPDADIQ